jgi:hypothetical protein
MTAWGGQRRACAVPTLQSVLLKVGTLALCPPYRLRVCQACFAERTKPNSAIAAIASEISTL